MCVEGEQRKPSPEEASMRTSGVERLVCAKRKTYSSRQGIERRCKHREPPMDRRTNERARPWSGPDGRDSETGQDDRGERRSSAK